jgi:hypothetical protein
MCADSTNSRPPPKANPFTAAMIGFGKDSTRPVIWWSGRNRDGAAVVALQDG